MLLTLFIYCYPFVYGMAICSNMMISQLALFECLISYPCAVFVVIKQLSYFNKAGKAT